MSERIVIRASQLASYPDCHRRAAAEIFKDEIAAAGFTLRRRVSHIGAAAGIGCHAAATYTLKQKREHGHLGSEDDAAELAIAALNTEIEGGVIFDDATRNRQAAEAQVLRLVRQYRRQVAPEIEPVAVEERLTAECHIQDLGGVEVIITGQPDVMVDRGINDLKTGTQRRANGVQYGCYAMLARSHNIPIDRLTEVYLPRVRANREQPPATWHEYDPEEAERAADALIHRLVADLVAFRRTADPWSFLANPHSQLCSERFCPAHSGGPNGFCKAWKQ